MNQGIYQPWLALVTAIFTVVISFSIIAVVGEHLFILGCLLARAMIPTQIYISVTKRCAQPAWIARMRRPLRGLAFTGLIGAAGAIIGTLMYQVYQWAAPLVVAVGDKESAEFHRQTSEYATYSAAAGNSVTHVELPGHDHLSLLWDLSDSKGRLCASACQQMGLTK